MPIRLALLSIVALSMNAQQHSARSLFFSSLDADSARDARLGVRYSLLKESADGEDVEVDPKTVFRASDQIRLCVAASTSAYVYVVHHGSSGQWATLFFPERPVRAGQRNTIPSGGKFVFDDKPGTEQLYLIISRDRLDDRLLSRATRDSPRDLLTEKVDNAEDRESAIYVVVPDGAADGRLVVKLLLQHR
jgi:hypothetical protein